MAKKKVKEILTEHYRKIGKMGGLATAAKLTRSQRIKSAKKASDARWNKVKG